jgi:uncharacterized membrane protein
MEARMRSLILLTILAGCAQHAPRRGPNPVQEHYTARGQEPGWALTIANGRIDYIGNYGEKKINIPRPDPRTTFNGRRYETARLIVDVTHGPLQRRDERPWLCRPGDVIADGETYSGCGGQRRTDWDN